MTFYEGNTLQGHQVCFSAALSFLLCIFELYESSSLEFHQLPWTIKIMAFTNPMLVCFPLCAPAFFVTDFLSAFVVFLFPIFFYLRRALICYTNSWLLWISLLFSPFFSMLSYFWQVHIANKYCSIVLSFFFLFDAFYKFSSCELKPLFHELLNIS